MRIRIRSEMSNVRKLQLEKNRKLTPRTFPKFSTLTVLLAGIITLTACENTSTKDKTDKRDNYLIEEITDVREDLVSDRTLRPPKIHETTPSYELIGTWADVSSLSSELSLYEGSSVD